MTPANRNTNNPRPKTRNAAKRTRTPQTVGNVRTAGVNRKAPKSRTLDQQVAAIPIERGEFVLTRRHFVYGAAALAGVAAVGGGAYAFNAVMGPEEEEIVVLDVTADAVTSSDDIQQVEYTSCVALIGDFELDYGTMVWCNDDAVAACLLPGASGKPLTQAALLWLSSGTTSTVLEQAVGASEGFEIVDVRATSNGLLWVESDMLEGTWRVYTAALSDSGNMGEPVLADEGDGDWETPTIALAGAFAYWQVLPRSDGARAKEASVLRHARVGSGKAEVAWESQGRMATPPYATEDKIVITPRADADSSVHYQMPCLKASSGEMVDSCTLPASMKPLEAGYSDNGFTFAFDAIYSNDTGIANLGTYAPSAKAAGDGYSGVPWFRWGRTPSCAPANCGDYLVVKSKTAVCGVNLGTQTYFALDVESGSADYGDMLASSGSRDTFVTYANVVSKPLKEASKQYCHVRVWTAL